MLRLLTANVPASAILGAGGPDVVNQLRDLAPYFTAPEHTRISTALREA